jgi:flavin-dependent dehydrogenase
MIDLGISILENAGFPPIFANLLSLSAPEKMIHRPYYIHPATAPVSAQLAWSFGRVVLIGDAAHGMPPFMAQGVNQGFEDAACISTLIAQLVQKNRLTEERAIADVLGQYENLRLPFMKFVQEATMNNTDWSQQQRDDYDQMIYGRTCDEMLNKSY